MGGSYRTLVLAEHGIAQGEHSRLTTLGSRVNPINSIVDRYLAEIRREASLVKLFP